MELMLLCRTIEAERAAQVGLVNEVVPVGEALARAGGANQNGAINRVRVLRLQPNGQQQQVVLNLADANSSEGTLPIRSGDQIVVDRRRSFFREILVPALGIIGSIASLGLLIDRVGRNNNN
jgi:enoyl-CoA hydratase/carnithine racemase